MPMLVEKATELGVGKLQPVIMERCAARDVNVHRLTTIATEAAEQSNRLTIPQIESPRRLFDILAQWDHQIPLLACDERLASIDRPTQIGKLPGLSPSSNVLVGPEGGFSDAEFQALAALNYIRFVSLGSNILRAETACITALGVIATK